MTDLFAPALYKGTVFHERHKPFSHRLKYRVFSLYCNIDELPGLAKRLRFFSYNRWNILSLYDRDHGARDGGPLRPWIEKAAASKDIDLNGGTIMFCGFPRLFGYAFTPLTLFYCFDRDQKLRGIMYQVKNTFGEQHGYFLPVTEERQGRIRQKTDKIFHVSPFIHMDCTYHFRLRVPDEALQIAIHQEDAKGKLLTATWDGARYDMSDRRILAFAARQPFMTVKIIVGIHWEAFKMLFKGAKYIRKPPPPARDISS